MGERIIYNTTDGDPPGDIMAMLRDVADERGSELVPGRTGACPECGFIAVVPNDESMPKCEACMIRVLHDEGCRYRLAATCPIPIPCEKHERDVCPECDACNCENQPEDDDATDRT